MSETATPEQLLDSIQANAPDHLESTDAAREALEAVMKTLGERISDGQANHLAATLPDVAGDPLEAPAGEAEGFGATDFLERVHNRSDSDASALTQTRAVINGIESDGAVLELESAREQLPTEYELLFEAGQPMASSEFLERIDERLPDGVALSAKEATDVTLETLGERITGGEAADLATYLPREVTTPLERTDEEAADFDLTTFLDRVSYRGNISDRDAMAVTQAVLRVVAETAAANELSNVHAQLPDTFDELFD